MFRKFISRSRCFIEFVGLWGYRKCIICVLVRVFFTISLLFSVVFIVLDVRILRVGIIIKVLSC